MICPRCTGQEKMKVSYRDTRLYADGTIGIAIIWRCPQCGQSATEHRTIPKPVPPPPLITYTP